MATVEIGGYTEYTFDRGSIIADYDKEENRKTRYIRGYDLISQKGDEGETSYYLHNAHGDITKLVDSAGNVQNSYSYDAFGNNTSYTEKVENRFRYAGEQYDAVTGQYYLRARYYDPAMGRFINEDTYRGQIENPSSQNLYTYCVNNPVIYIDPSGHRVEGDGGGKSKCGSGKDDMGTSQDITNDVGHIISNVEICVGFVSTKAETYYFDDAGNQHFRGNYTSNCQVLSDEYGRYPINGYVEKHSFEYLNMVVYKNPNGTTFNIDALSAREDKSQSFVRDSDEINSTIAELSDLNYKNRYKTAWKWTQAGVSAAMDISTIVTFGTAAAGTTSVKAGLLAGSKTLITREAIVQSAGVNGLMMAGDKVFYNENPSSSSALNFVPIVATIYAIDNAMNNDEVMQGAFVDSDYVKVFVDSLK